jgi:hypothetical protein
MGAIGWAAAAYVAVWLLAAPLTLLHELGHALTALAVGVRRVTVHVGRPPTRALSAGRLELRIRLLNGPRWAWFGIYELPEAEKVSRGRLIAVHAAGPVVTAVVLLVLLAGTAFVPGRRSSWSGCSRGRSPSSCS